MKLHQNPELFRDAVLATAQRLKMPEVYIEKDYWVTLSLQKIFTSNVAADTIFKGGTALSKCFKLINRFSEDIDIVILQKEGESATRLSKKLKTIYHAIVADLPKVEIEGITNKKGMIRKTAHSYPKSGLNGLYGQVREHIILESTWFGRAESFAIKTVNSYIGEMMEISGQQNIAAEYDMLPFEVQVLAVERTLCEKIMSLVRFSFSEAPYTNLANKIRHVYDLHQMLQDKNIRLFFDSQAFEEMLNSAGKADAESFKSNTKWLTNHPSTAIIFKEHILVWENIRYAYHGPFRSLLIGEDIPGEKSLLNTLALIAKRLKEIKWGVI